MALVHPGYEPRGPYATTARLACQSRVSTVGASEVSNSLRSIGQIGDEWPCYNNVHAWDITCDPNCKATSTSNQT
eukprot:4230358-Prymnesium_polylepis.1